MEKVYGRKDKYPTRIYFLLWALFALGYILIISLYKNSVWMTIFGFLSMLLITCFYRQYKNKLIYTSFFYLYLAIMDISSIPIVYLLSQAKIEQTIHIEFFNLCMPVVSSVLIIVTVREIVQYINRNQYKKSRFNINTIFFLALLMELIILIYGVFLSERRSANLEVLSLTLFFFLVFDLLGIYLYHLVQIEEHLKEELILSKQKDELEYQHLQQLQEEYEKTRKILHDMKNHILAIEGLSFSENPRAKEYINEVIENMDKNNSGFHTRNKIISTLVNSKIEKTKIEEISFHVEVQDMNFDFISDLDWVIILGNILDNAIEACQQIREGERKIELYIHQYKKMLIIRLENSVGNRPNFQCGMLHSNKPGHFGIGLSNVQDVVKKYEGDMELEFNDSCFKTRIIIPVK
ncbi:MAG: sensor histidine kinase [Negativibacillus massiliensis]|uniref:sensor histidine kinase n=1 Tax=Negativibacillus massiliensis TaxID=1871035 RepID=UPI0039A37F43